MRHPANAILQDLDVGVDQLSYLADRKLQVGSKDWRSLSETEKHPLRQAQGRLRR